MPPSPLCPRASLPEGSSLTQKLLAGDEAVLARTLPSPPATPQSTKGRSGTRAVGLEPERLSSSRNGFRHRPLCDNRKTTWRRRGRTAAAREAREG
jgi:hypothetical protein